MSRKLTILVVVASLVGCGGKEEGPDDGAPELEMSDLDYEDLDCVDRVPFDFTVTNVGDADAENVTVQVGVDGEAMFSDDVGTIAQGDVVSVSGEFTASDTCLVADAYTVRISLTPSNGGEADFTVAVAI